MGLKTMRKSTRKPLGADLSPSSTNPTSTPKKEKSLVVAPPEAPTTPKLLSKPNFPISASVRKAKEALKAQAYEIYEEYRATIREARVAGKYEEALNAYKWLIDHIPSEEGERLIEGSSDKVKEVESGNRGPIIQIGIAMGDPKSKKLTGNVIDVLPEK